MLFVGDPDQSLPGDQQEHLVLEGVLVIRRCLALADIEAPDHQLPVGSRAVEQDREGAAVQPLQLLLLLGLGEIGHAQRDFPSLVRR